MTVSVELVRVVLAIVLGLSRFPQLIDLGFQGANFLLHGSPVVLGLSHDLVPDPAVLPLQGRIGRIQLKDSTTRQEAA